MAASDISLAFSVSTLLYTYGSRMQTAFSKVVFHRIRFMCPSQFSHALFEEMGAVWPNIRSQDGESVPRRKELDSDAATGGHPKVRAQEVRDAQSSMMTRIKEKGKGDKRQRTPSPKPETTTRTGTSLQEKQIDLFVTS